MMAAGAVTAAAVHAVSPGMAAVVVRRGAVAVEEGVERIHDVSLDRVVRHILR